jgi:deoxycytidine triphosphate deaminase
MILSRPEIQAAVERGDVKFDPPLEERQWGEASVDLRLGLDFTQLKKVDGVTVSMANGIGAIAQTGLWQGRTLKVKNDFGSAIRSF